MRLLSGLAAALLTASAVHAAELTPQEDALLSAILKDKDKVARLKARIEAKESEAVPAPSKDKWTFILKKQQRNAKKEWSPCAGILALLRYDWVDVGTLSCPDTTDFAQGAQFSFTHDRETKNKVWNAHGMAGVFYSSTEDNDINRYDLFRTAFGAYFSFDQNDNSKNKDEDVEKLAYGGSLELGISSPATVAWDHYIRIRGGGVRDGVNNVDSVAITAEYIPSILDARIHYPSTEILGIKLPFSYLFTPSLLAQYNRLVSNDSGLAFNDRRNAYRLGPQLGLKIRPLAQDVAEDDIWSRWLITASYHWGYEFERGKDIELLNAAFTYNLDEVGHIGVTASYQRGNDEDTGVRANLFRVGLSGKF